MRFLFSSYPLYGHLLPMLPMARAAQQLGHDVVIAVGGSMAARIQGYDFDVWRVEAEDHGPELTEHSWIPGPPADISGRLRAPELVRRAEAWKPHFIIHEPLDYAAPIAAARARARRLVHGLGPVLPASVHAFLRPGLDALFEAWGRPELSSTLFSAPYLDIWPPGLPSNEPSPWANRRPLRPTAIELGELPCILARLPHPHTINLTLGTVVNKDLTLFEMILSGLHDIAANVIATVGHDVDPAILGPQPAHVVVERFVPHGLLLPHCHLVINHAGNGSVLASLAHGLPMLLLPRGADQLLTAVSCARAKVGVFLRPNRISRASVARVVSLLLQEPGPRAAAQRIREEIARMPDPKTVIHDLVRET